MEERVEPNSVATDGNPEAPCITVIIPVYNGRPWLDQCLESVLGQEGPSFEVILVDDGSTDGSGAMADAWATRDPRLRVVHTAQSGTYPARNRALDLARGEFLFFVDADDWIDPGTFDYLRRTQRDTKADFLRLQRRMHFPDGLIPGTTISQSRRLPREGLVELVEEDGRLTVVFAGNITAALIRRSLLTDNGIKFREDILSGADSLLILDLAAIPHRYVFCNVALYHYRRQFANSLTLTYSPTKTRRAENQLLVQEESIRYIEGRWGASAAEQAMGDGYINSFIRYLVSCAADAVATDGEEPFIRFRGAFLSGTWRRFLPHYRPADNRNKSRLLPLLLRLGWVRAGFWLCRRKARIRYRRELSALTAAD
ncbi:MAG: glycosyltransferase [Planctomycetes bacterium]|nr:glycosyltransferase [Planctomycetota bacterium]